MAGPDRYEQWLKEERDREAMDADRPRRRALATRRSEIGFGEDVAGAVTRGITKPATSMARGIGWITKKLTGGRVGQGAEDWADEADRAVAEYTGTRIGGTGMTPESEALDPGMAGWAEVPARLLGEVAQTAVGGGLIKNVLTSARAARVIPKVAGTLSRWEKGGAVARTAASGVPFLPVDVVQGAGSAMPDEEGNPRGFVLPGRGGAAVENVLMGNVPMLGLEAGVDAYRAAKQARAFEESLARAAERSAPYRYAKAQNTAEVRPSRLLAARSEPFPSTSGPRQGPGIPTPDASFVSREVPETRAERLLASGIPRAEAGPGPVGPAIPAGAVAPDIEGLFGVVPPERRLARGPLVTPPPVDPMEEALKYSRGRQAERAARGESSFDLHDFMARRRGEPTAEEVERAAMRGDPLEAPAAPVRGPKNAEGYFEDVRTGGGVYRKLSRVSNEGLMRQLAEYADERLGVQSHTPAIKAMTKRLDEIEQELERRGLTQDQIWGPELERVRQERAGKKSAEQAAADSYVEPDEDTSFDFGPRAGATRAAVVQTLGGGGAGAAAGGLVGDTPEERKRNAAIGFAAGAGAGAGAAAVRPISRIIKNVRGAKRARDMRAFIDEGQRSAREALGGADIRDPDALLDAAIGARWKASPRGQALQAPAAAPSVASGRAAKPRTLSVASYRDTPGARDLAHRFKAGDKEAIAEMADQMAAKVPADAVLVPIPGRNGTPVQTLALAEALAERTGRPVADVLRGGKRPALYDAKKAGSSLTPRQMLMRATGKVPEGRVVLVDGVTATGKTAAAARRALPGADLLVHSVDETAAPALGRLRAGAVGDVEKVGGSGSPLGQNRKPAARPAVEHAAESDEVVEDAARAIYDRLHTRKPGDWDALPADEKAAQLAAFRRGKESDFAKRLYSRAAKAINDAPFAKGTAEQWMAALSKGVSKGEREQAGLDAFLAENKGKVLTREQVAEVFNQNRIRLGEKVFGGREQPYGSSKYDTYTLPGGENYRETVLTLEKPQKRAQVPLPYKVEEHFSAGGRTWVVRHPVTEQIVNYGNTRAEAQQWAEAHAREFPALGSLEVRNEYRWGLRNTGTGNIGHGFSNPQEATEYLAAMPADRRRFYEVVNMQQLPAEEIRRLPEDWVQTPDPRESSAETYRSSHWSGVDNPLLHIRTKDRIAPDGKKVLHVEELQSDWHQQGREKGYRTPAPPITAEQTKAGEDALASVMEQMKAEVRASHPDWNATHLDQFTRGARLTLPAHVAEAGPAGVRRWARADLPGVQVSDEQAEAIARIFPNEKWTDAVPDAPFKKTDQWVELGLKRILDDAVRGGYDRVAFVTGKQSADRYNLAQYVDDLRYNPATSELEAYKNGKVIHSGKYDEKALPEVIGKDAAKRLLETPPIREDDLVEEFNAWLKRNDLPEESADELLARPGLTPLQRKYLTNFAERWEAPGVHQLSGEGLQVGGQGMVEFYDKMVPKVLRDYAKTLGIEIEFKPGTKSSSPVLDAGAIDQLGKQHFSAGDEATASHLAGIAESMREGDYSDWRQVVATMREELQHPEDIGNSVWADITKEGTDAAERILAKAEASGAVSDSDLLWLAKSRARAEPGEWSDDVAESIDSIETFANDTGVSVLEALESWMDGPGADLGPATSATVARHIKAVAARRGQPFNASLHDSGALQRFSEVLGDTDEARGVRALADAMVDAPPGTNFDEGMEVAREMMADTDSAADEALAADHNFWDKLGRRLAREEFARKKVLATVDRYQTRVGTELDMVNDFANELLGGGGKGSPVAAEYMKRAVRAIRRRGNGGILSVIDYIAQEPRANVAQRSLAAQWNATRWLEELYFAKNTASQPWLEGMTFDITPELAAKVKAGQRLGFMEPAVASTLTGAAVGGVTGSAVGDTPEERKRNAVAGVLVGAAAGAGAGRVVSGASRRAAAAAAKASTPALAKAATMVAAGERGVARGASFLTNAEKAYTDIVDEAFPLSKFGREYDVTNPERLAETVAQGQGWRGQARLHMAEKVQPILKRIKGREADVQGYVVAKREQQLRAQGGAAKTDMTDAEIAAAVRDGDADPVLVQAQKDLTAAYRDLLTMRRDVGLLTPDKYDAILASEDFYTPFTREWGGETGAAGGGNSAGKFINRGAGVRKMDREAIANAKITDPLERLVLDAADTYRQVAKQKVTNVVGEIVGQHQGGIPGLLREVPAGDTPKPTARIVEPMVGGARKRYEVTDPDFYDAWASFDPRTMGIAEKIGAYFKRTLQAGVTLLPDFAIANLARDTGGAAIQQPVRKLLKRAGAGAAAGAVAGAVTADEDESAFLRALTGAGLGSGVSSIGPQVLKALGATRSILTNDATYKAFLKEGGSTEMGFYPRNIEDARKVLKDLRREGVDLTDIINPKRWVDAMFYIGSVAEQATRVAKFAEMRRTGASGAASALGAQDVSLRFGNIGKRTKGIASVTPFWNAGVQGWDKLARMVKDPRTAAAGIATLTAPTMALWNVNKDNPEYWARPQWERNMFWLLPKEEGGFYRIAKPFQIGFLFGSLPERLADFAYQKAKGGDADPGETFRAGALDMVSTTMEGTLPVPTVLGVAAEQTANYDAFRNRPIVTRPELPRAMQQDERTSFLAKTVGEKANLSPQRIDHLVRSLTGSAGAVALNLTDAAARRVGLDDRADPAPGVPVLARRFVTNDAGTTDQEQMVRRRWSDAERVYRGARQLEAEVKKAGADPAKLKAYVEEHRAELLARKQLEDVIKGLNEISDRRRALKKDRRIDSATRQEQLQVLRLLGQELAQRGLAPTTTTTARVSP